MYGNGEQGKKIRFGGRGDKLNFGETDFFFFLFVECDLREEKSSRQFDMGLRYRGQGQNGSLEKKKKPLIFIDNDDVRNDKYKDPFVLAS